MLSHSLKLQQQASRSACAACRLRQDIAVKQLARSRWSGGLQVLARNANASASSWNHGGSKRGFAGSAALGVRMRRAGGRGMGAREEKAGEVGEQASRSRQEQEQEQDEEAEAEEEPREISSEQARLSRLLYASSLKANMSTQRLIELVNVLRQDLSAEQRALEVRKAFGDTLPEGLLGEEDEMVYLRLYGEPVVRLWERDLEALEEEVLVEEMEEGEEEGTNLARKGPEGEFEEVEFVDEEGEEVGEGEEGEGEVLEGDDARLRADIRNALDAEEALEEVDEEAEEEDEFGPMMRAHPLTVAGRFATSPSSIQLPRDTFVEPVQLLISRTAPVHLKDAAHKVFGGIGLPYSASTPSLAKTMQQKPIPLDATQYRMSDIDANSFLSVLMPAMYSSVMATLVETRKRLGTAWAEQLVRKAEAGELKILDAGGAGAGVLAVRDMLKAEWQRMREEDPEAAASTAVAEADGKVGGAALSPPLGSATVLTASDALRQRSAALLENTTFIPRLPDYVHAETETARKTGKFDLVIAPHTLFPIREEWARRNHVDNLWSLVNSEGGVLVMLEKGIARGFEAIALAREHVLKTHIATPGPEEERTQNIDEEEVVWDEPSKETGMIIAPCTNHTECPMYSGKNKGVIKGRKDICHFQQRYTRPTFLQKILGARDKNFEDVKFSYVALMRGRDLRVPMPERADDSAFANSPTAVQGDEATDSAFAGYEHVEEAADSSASPETATTAPSPFSLPRQILHPLKRRGHVILDMCTPAGSLERWTVPRSFSKRAFRDARKASWGDLWALGAKTRVVKTARVGDKKRLKAEEKAQGEGEEGGRPERKKLTKRVAKEKRRVKERKAGKKGVILGRVGEGDEELD